MALTKRARDTLADDIVVKRPAKSSTLFFERMSELAVIVGEERHLRLHMLHAESKYGVDLTDEKSTVDREISERG